jgi:nucleoside-diphosphate kinase
VKSGDFARIIDMVLSSQNFVISALQMFELDKTSASEFLEVYDGVMPNFKDMVVDFCSGPIIAIEVKHAGGAAAGPRADSASVISAFRDFVGPWDVEMAKELRPKSIRAQFGKGRTENAIHCTDLPDDGLAEVSYFFDVLQGS